MVSESQGANGCRVPAACAPGIASIETRIVTLRVVFMFIGLFFPTTSWSCLGLLLRHRFLTEEVNILFLRLPPSRKPDR